jgi:GMP synthase PP-ATPase subunit
VRKPTGTSESTLSAGGYSPRVQPSIRTHEVGSSALVVTLTGELDSWTAGLLAAALAEHVDRTVVVDLLSARNVEERVLDMILAAAHGDDVVVVADAQLLHVFDLRRTSPLGLQTSLAAAVAACG